MSSTSPPDSRLSTRKRYVYALCSRDSRLKRHRSSPKSECDPSRLQSCRYCRQRAQDTDKSDPALLLVSHNRRKADARYTTKLLPTENVLDNGSTAEEDFTSGNEQPMATPLAVIPPILPPLPSPRHVSRRSSSKSMRPLGIFGPAGRLQTVTARQFREIEQLANIELGPNPQQRVENAGRGIGASSVSTCIAVNLTWSTAELVLDPASGLYNGDEGEGRPAVVLLCGANSLKGPSALRAGAHLLNRGVHVTAFVPPSETLPGVRPLVSFVI
jgi:hypothetical protein